MPGRRPALRARGTLRRGATPRWSRRCPAPVRRRGLRRAATPVRPLRGLLRRGAIRSIGRGRSRPSATRRRRELGRARSSDAALRLRCRWPPVVRGRGASRAQSVRWLIASAAAGLTASAVGRSSRGATVGHPCACAQPDAARVCRVGRSGHDRRRRRVLSARAPSSSPEALRCRRFLRWRRRSSLRCDGFAAQALHAASPFFATGLLRLAQGLDHCVGVPLDLHAAPDASHPAVGRDEERRPNRSFNLLSVHHLLAPRPVGLVGHELGVAQEGEAELELVAERAVALHRVPRDAGDLGPELSQPGDRSCEILGFDGAARRAVHMVVGNEPPAKSSRVTRALASLSRSKSGAAAPTSTVMAAMLPDVAAHGAVRKDSRVSRVLADQFRRSRDRPQTRLLRARAECEDLAIFARCRSSPRPRARGRLMTLETKDDRTPVLRRAPLSLRGEVGARRRR